MSSAEPSGRGSQCFPGSRMLDEGRQEHEHDRARRDEPRPTLVEQSLRHGAQASKRAVARPREAVYTRRRMSLHLDAQRVSRSVSPRVPARAPRCSRRVGCGQDGDPLEEIRSAARARRLRGSRSSRCASCSRAARRPRGRTTSTGTRSSLTRAAVASRPGRCARRWRIPNWTVPAGHPARPRGARHRRLQRGGRAPRTRVLEQRAREHRGAARARERARLLAEGSRAALADAERVLELDPDRSTRSKPRILALLALDAHRRGARGDRGARPPHRGGRFARGHARVVLRHHRRSSPRRAATRSARASSGRSVSRTTPASPTWSARR